MRLTAYHSMFNAHLVTPNHESTFHSLVLATSDIPMDTKLITLDSVSNNVEISTTAKDLSTITNLVGLEAVNASMAKATNSALSIATGGGDVSLGVSNTTTSSVTEALAKGN